MKNLALESNSKSITYSALEEIYLMRANLDKVHPWICGLPLLFTLMIEYLWWTSSSGFIASQNSSLLGFYSVVIKLSLAVTASFMILTVLRLALYHGLKNSHIYIREFKPLRSFNSIIFHFLIVIVFLSEYFLGSLKTIFALVAIIHPSVRNALGMTNVAYYAVLVLIWIDQAVFLLFGLFKVSFIRTFVTKDRSLFSKLNNSFEQMYIFLMHLRLVLVAIRAKIDSNSNKELGNLIEGFIATINLGLIWKLWTTHPFISRSLNFLIASFLGIYLQLSIYRIILWNKEWNKILPLLLLSGPFTVILLWKVFMNWIPNDTMRIIKLMIDKQKSAMVKARIISESRTATMHKLHTDVLKFTKSGGDAHNVYAFAKLDEVSKLLDGCSSKPQGAGGLIAEAVQSSADTTEIDKLSYQLLLRAEHENSKDPYMYFLIIEWLLANHPSMYLVLLKLGKMKKFVQGFKDEYLFLCIRKEVENFLKTYYSTSYTYKKIQINQEEANKRISEMPSGLIVKGPKLSYKVLSSLHYSSLDLAYVFYYKTQIQAMVDSISNFTDTTIKLMDTLSEKKSEFTKLIKTLDKLYVQNTRISDTFNSFNNLTNKVEYIHYVSYIYHLNFNVNQYESARGLFKDFTKRAHQLQSCADFKFSKITNNNLYVESFYLLIDNDRKNQGKILDIYGNYHLFVDNYQDVIGKNYDVFLTATLKEFHHQISSSIFEGSLDSYRVMGSYFPGFVRLPGKDFVAYSNTVSKIVPFIESDFKFISGVKPLLSYYEDKYFILLDSNFNVEGYSYNFLHLLPETFLLATTNLRTLSSATYQRISQMRETKAQMKQPLIYDMRRGSSDKSKTRNSSLSISRSYFDELRSSRMILNNSNLPTNYLPSEEERTLDDILKFTDKDNNTRTKKFTILIEYKDFLLTHDGYWYLMLTLREDSMSKPTHTYSSSEEADRGQVSSKSSSRGKVDSLAQYGEQIDLPLPLVPQIPPVSSQELGGEEEYLSEVEEIAINEDLAIDKHIKTTSKFVGMPGRSKSDKTSFNTMTNRGIRKISLQ